VKMGIKGSLGRGGERRSGERGWAWRDSGAAGESAGHYIFLMFASGGSGRDCEHYAGAKLGLAAGERSGFPCPA
jgi:hypothetical protein